MNRSSAVPAAAPAGPGGSTGVPGMAGGWLASPLARGRLAVMAAAVLWSFGGVVVKLAHPVLNSWQISGLRSFFAVLFLAAVLRPWRARPLWPSGRLLLLAVCYTVMMVTFILATTLTTAANAIFLQDTAPVWVMVCSPWLLKEPLRARDLGIVAACGVGLFLFFQDQLNAQQVLGNLVALLSGVFYAAVFLGIRWGRRQSGEAPLQAGSGPVQEQGPSQAELMIFWGNLLCVLLTLPWLVQIPRSAEVLTPLGLVAFLGIFQIGLSYWLLTRGLRHIPAMEGSLLGLIEPVLNPIWAYLWAHEPVGEWALAGGAVILASLSWMALRRGQGS